MAEGGRAAVDGAAEIETADDRFRTEVEGRFHGFRELAVGNLAGAKGVHHDGNRLCHADGIGKLDLAALGKPGCHDVLCDVPRRIGCTAVHLGGILAGECAAAVARVTAIGVHDDFAPCEAGVTVRPADDEAAGGVHEDARVFIQQLCRDDGANHMGDYRLADLFLRHIRVMLRADDDGVHAHGFVALIFHADLRLAVRPEEGQFAAFAHGAELARERMGEIDGQRHIFRRFVAGIAEHHALIARAGCKIGFLAGFCFERAIHAKRDVRGLFAKRNEDGAGFAVKAVGGIVIADVADDAAHEGGDVKRRICGDFAHHEREARRDAALTCHAGLRIFRKAGVQHRVGKLIADFVRMSVRDGFRGKQAFFHGSLLLCLLGWVFAFFGANKNVPRKTRRLYDSLIFRLLPRELAPCACAGCRVSQGPSLNHS